MRFWLFTLILLLLFTAGCLDHTSSAVQKAYKEYGAMMVATNPSSYIDSVDYKVSNAPKMCYVFVCHNATSKAYFGLGGFFKGTSLLGGNCSIYNFTPDSNGFDKYMELVKDSDTQVRELALGGGPSLADFNDGTRYCNNSYNLAEYVITGSGSAYDLPPLPSISASCVLEKGRLPLFILYNKGSLQADNRTTPPALLSSVVSLADALNGTGPVIVATELLPRNNSVTYQRVKQEAKILKSHCKNCLVFLSITLDEANESNAFYVNKVLSDAELNKSIDGIGFGIDSRFLPNETLKEGANPEDIFATAVMPLMNRIALNTTKLMLIYYVYLPPNSVRSYSDEDYAAIYNLFFTSAPYLANLGLIGFVGQPFYETTSIFPCDDCALTYKDGNGNLQSGKAFSTWFSLCRAYYVKAIHPYVVFGKNGARCDMYAPTSLETYSFDGYVDATGKLEVEPTLKSAEETFFKCSNCLLSGKLPEPFDSFDYSLPADTCDKTNEVYAAAAAKGLDGVIARDIAMLESGGNRCYAQCGGALDVNTVNTYLSAASCPTISCNNGVNEHLGIFGLTQPPSQNFNPFNEDDSAKVFTAEYKKAAADALDTISFFKEEAGLPPDDKNSETFRGYVVGGILGELSGVERWWDNYFDLWRATDANDCSFLTADEQALCCKKSSDDNDDSSGSKLEFSDPHGVCTVHNFGDYLENIVEKNSYFTTLDPDYYKYGEALRLFSSIYNTCEDCYSSKWLENICDKAEEYSGEKPEGCP